MHCSFCNSWQRILKENEHAYVLLSNPRKVPGHFLVIPKRHIEKPWDQTPEEILAIFSLLIFVQQHIVPSFAEGCDMRQHYRPFLPERETKVNHVHYHVIPRSLNDAIFQKIEKHETALFENLSQEEHDQIAKLLE